MLVDDGLERDLDLRAARRRELQRAVGLARVEDRALLVRVRVRVRGRGRVRVRVRVRVTFSSIA